jgi:adenylate cyclase class IV
LVDSYNDLARNKNVKYISYKKITQQFYRSDYDTFAVEEVTLSRLASKLLNILEEQGYVEVAIVRKKRKLYTFKNREEIGYVNC